MWSTSVGMLSTPVIKDMLAALHIIIQNKSQFKEIVNAELNANTSTNVQTLVFGTIMDDMLVKPVKTFAENDVGFAEKRKVLKRILISRLTNTLSDIQTLHLLHEFKAGNIATLKNAPTIKRFKTQNLCMDATSLPLLLKQRMMDIDCLIISGEPMPNDLEQLWRLLQNNSKTRECRLTDYGILYTAEPSKIQMALLKSDDVAVLAAFLRHAPKNTNVSVKSYHVNGKNRSYDEEIKELGDMAKRYDFKVRVLNVQGYARGMAKVLCNMLTEKPRSPVDAVKIQGAIVSVKRNTPQLDRLIFNGHLTDSEMMIEIVREGRWSYIESRNFIIRLRGATMLEVVKEFVSQQISYVCLCKFMIKLRCVSLICYDVNLQAEYDISKGTYKLAFSLKPICHPDESRLKGFCRFLLTSNASLVRFKNMEFVSESNEKSVRLKIRQIDEEQLLSLNYLLSLSDIAVNSVEILNLDDRKIGLTNLIYFARRTKLLIGKVSLEEIDLEYPDISFWRDHGVEDLLVKNCKIDSFHLSDVERLLASFDILLQQGRLCCKVDTLHVNVNLCEVTPRILDFMTQGKLLKVVSHGEAELSLWRDQGRQIFKLSISKANPADLDKLMYEVGLKPDEVLLEECDVGARGLAVLTEMIATAQDIPEDMHRNVMEFTNSIGQRKVEEHFLLLDRFLSQYRRTKVNSLNINGDFGRFDYLMDLMRNLSICSITSYNGTIQPSPYHSPNNRYQEIIVNLKKITLADTEALDFLLNQNGDCKVQVEKLDLEDLNTGDNMEKFDAARYLFQSESIIVKIVQTSSDLATITDELSYILQHLKPKTIITTAFNTEIEYPSTGKIRLYAKQRPNYSNVSYEALARFAERVGGEYFVREAHSHDKSETTPKQLLTKNFTSDNTTPKEIANSESEIQGSLEDGNVGEYAYEYIDEEALPALPSWPARDADSVDYYNVEHLYDN